MWAAGVWDVFMWFGKGVVVGVWRRSRWVGQPPRSPGKISCKVAHACEEAKRDHVRGNKSDALLANLPRGLTNPTAPPSTHPQPPLSQTT